MRDQKQVGSQKAKRGVLILDDHPIFRSGLAQFIDKERDLFVCWEGESALEVYDAVEKLNPELAIIDLSLERSDAMELIKNLRTSRPNLTVLVLSMHNELHYAERSLRAGARGYIMKTEPPARILASIRTVMDGKVYLSDKMKDRIMGQLLYKRRDSGGSAVDVLSDRELEVFRLIGYGQTTRQIAESLFLSIKTIEAYRNHILVKLNLANPTELAQHAFDWVRCEN